MDLTSAIGSLGTDYVTKISEAMQNNVIQNSGGEQITETTGLFDSIFNAVSSHVESTNSYIQRAQQAEVDFALGKMNNTHELGVYQQQANIALQFTVAVRDKALEAYKEIMNMQI